MEKQLQTAIKQVQSFTLTHFSKHENTLLTDFLISLISFHHNSLTTVGFTVRIITFYSAKPDKHTGNKAAYRPQPCQRFSTPVYLVL